MWDVTCPDTLAQSHLNRAVTGSGVVATDAESRKRIKYEIISPDSLFRAHSCQTLGALGEEATAFLKDLGGRIAEVTKERRAVEFLLQRISVAIQRGNAACVLGITPDCNRNLDDIYYIV